VTVRFGAAAVGWEGDAATRSFKKQEKTLLLSLK